jgi:DNA helicase-2/ATP-dependent DNA helicase PcrA
MPLAMTVWSVNLNGRRSQVQPQWHVDLVRLGRLSRQAQTRYPFGEHVVEDLFCDLESRLNGPIALLIERLVAVTRYEEHLKKKFADDYEERLENVHELIGAAQFYDQRAGDENDVVGFLTEVGLVSDVDGYEPDRAAVPLMTLHTSKGLEFDEVVIAGLEEGLLPHARSDDAESLEEERRLLFVGLTRARKKLTLTFALERRAQIGSKGRESSFLDELPQELLEREGLARFGRTGGAGSLGGGAWSQGYGGGFGSGGGSGAHAWNRGGGQRAGYANSWGVRSRSDHDGFVPDAPADEGPEFGIDDAPECEALAPGQRVEHSKFGRGQVRRLMGRGESARVVVFFRSCGEKTLSVAMAKLRQVDD